MAELGLNIYQVIQNELITREGNRQSIGLGFRLAIIEHKVENAEAAARNGRIWKLHHSISPIKGLTPEARRAAKAKERKLLRQEGRNHHKDPKDPTMLTREEEIWEVAEWFPRTLLEFKELQFSPSRIRGLMEFYNVLAYKSDQSVIDIHPEDGLKDVNMNLETCMEELAMAWGLNWQRIGGMTLPEFVPAGPPAHFATPPPRSSTYSP